MGLGPQLDGGVQYAGASEVTSPLQFEPNAERFSSRSVFGATAWQDRNARAQINVLGSGNSFDGNHLGAWGDAALQDGRFGHGFGAFWLGSTLAWANQLVGSDVRGAYYRVNYASRQWLWDAQIDYTAPLADTGFDTTTFVSGNARYQLSRIWRSAAAPTRASTALRRGRPTRSSRTLCGC